MYKKLVLSLSLIFVVLLITGCGKKTEELNKSTSPGEFSWKDDITFADIPDFPVKGFLNGKEVRINYTAFEIWRGSKDNVLNFSLTKPAQPCGYIENYQGFKLIKQKSSIERGNWSRSKFDRDPGLYRAYYSSSRQDGTPFRSECDWNCALEIENISAKIVTGKIAICFNDNVKSWIAGKFEAAICNN